MKDFLECGIRSQKNKSGGIAPHSKDEILESDVLCSSWGDYVFPKSASNNRPRLITRCAAHLGLPGRFFVEIGSAASLDFEHGFWHTTQGRFFAGGSLGIRLAFI